MDLYKCLTDALQPKIREPEKYVNSFKLPIETIENNILIKPNIQDDLELLKFKSSEIEDPSLNKFHNNLYYSLLKPDNIMLKPLYKKTYALL